MKKLLSGLTLFASGLLFGQQLDVPTSNVSSGIYTSDVTVVLSHNEPGATIFYTLNGSDPGPSDLIYSGPITLSNRVGDPNNYAEIKTNPSFDYPMGNYDETRANSRGWLPPYSEVYKVNILRYRAYKPGFAPSETVTQTIMIDPLGTSYYSMPIISIAIDSIDMFSASSGIYVYGMHPEGNYTQKGVSWERVSHLDYFDQDGNHVFARSTRTRIHGGGSRHSCKKNLRLYGDTGDENNFNYPFFEDYELDQYKRIILRSGGHRPDCFPRDNLANFLTMGLNVEQQHFRHVIVFVNGEYWGIHSIKERFDKYFFQNIYGIDDDEITVLDQEFDVQDGYAADSVEMKILENFVIDNDMSQQANYEFVADRVDISNYIDYMGSEIFLSNEDWVYSNVVIWRRTGAYNPELGAGYDGKFRWAFYDFDGAFGGSCDNAYYTVNTLEAATVETGTFSSYSRFFRGMLENPEFKRAFISRTCDLMNSWFKAEVMDDKIDSMYNMLTPEMYNDVYRWRYPSEATTLADRQLETPSLIQWDTTFYYLHRFANRRQRKVREHIMLKWGYPDTCFVTVDVNDTDMGRVKINTLLINEQLPGVSAGMYPWVGQYIDSVMIPLVAVPLPGYEFVQWMESGNTNDTIWWTPTGDSTFTAIFQPSSQFSPLVINEVMVSNSGYLTDNYGDYDDWLEIFNPNLYAIDLSGMKINRGTFSWTIPTGTHINANDYLIFWHDAETYQGLNHVSFKLPNDPDTLYLYTQNNQLMDQFIYPSLTTDYSYGRYPNGSGTFAIFDYPTPLANNDLSGTEDFSVVSNPLKVYPNPATDVVYVNKSINYFLFDLSGKEIKSGINATMVDVSQLDPGIYILRTTEQETAKIIVR